MKRLLLTILIAIPPTALAAEPRLAQPANTWVKRSPLTDGPPSPGLGYETSMGYDPKAGLIIRWGGHNQGGGGEQNAETWTFDLLTGKWTLREPNTSPVGVCCAQQNVFAPSVGRFVRFPSFSGSHGWHWFRENYLNNTAVWSYDLATNIWRDMRPTNAPRLSPLRCASWDSEHQVVVVFGGEGNQEGTLVYDPYTNLWTRMNPKVQPAFRSGGNMAYDAEHRLHILFGSQFTDDPHTWAYDLKKNEWRDMQPVVQPPTNKNDAVLAYDEAGKVVIAVVRVADKLNGDEIAMAHLETWAYDAGTNTWTPMKAKDEPAGKNNRSRILVAVPDQNVILMEQVVRKFEEVDGSPRDQQMWTYRYGEAKADPRPLPPTDVKVSTTADRATLTWKPSPSANIKGYRIMRREGEEQKTAVVGKDATTFSDNDLKPGMVHKYTVRTVNTDMEESAASFMVQTQPPLVEVVTVSVASPKRVRLGWIGVEDAVGYHVERAVVEVFSEDQIVRLKKDTPPLPEPSVGAIRAIGAFTRLTPQPIQADTYTDATVDLTRPMEVTGNPVFTHRFRDDQLDPKGKAYRYGIYAYRIRAVNALGVESGHSPYFPTIPSAPKWLFASEDGDQCLLTWAPCPEQGLKGYRVYRMDGPKLNGPGQAVRRLTAEPGEDATFTDTKAGKDTARYWIVGVDALGQEGFPSAPAWHYRQWRKFYEPFVGERHQ